MVPGMDGTAGIYSRRGPEGSVFLIELIPQTTQKDNIIVEINSEKFIRKTTVNNRINFYITDGMNHRWSDIIADVPFFIDPDKIR